MHFRLPCYYQNITFSYSIVSDLNSFEHRKVINYNSQAHTSFQPSYYYYMGAKYNITHKLTMIIKCQIRFCAHVNYCYPSDCIIFALCVSYTKEHKRYFCYLFLDFFLNEWKVTLNKTYWYSFSKLNANLQKGMLRDSWEEVTLEL